jgi:ribosomal protein S12 methylthiotransferase accessory factor YcaO
MTQTFIPGKDAALEATIETMRAKLAARGFILNESSLLHEVDGIWSNFEGSAVHQTRLAAYDKLFA